VTENVQSTTMISNPYPFLIHNRNKLYFFESTGKRLVHKLIQFSHVENNVFNLGLADFENGRLNFQNFTGNGDSYRVFNTVANAVMQFTIHYPNAEVLIRASEAKRLHLYNKIIEHRLDEINTLFDVFGVIDQNKGLNEPFQIEKKYEAFIIKRKLNLI
jgi:hypothetical protein